jgi:phytoene desaturase
VHGKEIYTTKQLPTNPLFYVSATSVTDASVAPENCENLFFLIPTATGLQGDTEELREQYFTMIVQRMEKKLENQFYHILYTKNRMHIAIL